MPSRVVHVRLDDWALLGCHDIVKSASKDADNMPMATIVRHVVNALVRNMQLSDKIPVYSREDLIDRLDELYDDKPLSLDVTLEPAEVLTEAAKVDSEINDIVLQALERIESEGEPQSISEPVEISDVGEISDIPSPPIDIMAQECEPFASFKKKAPKDRFIEWAETQESMIIEKAVALVYTGLPQELWGSDKAEDMIAGLLQKHRAHETKSESGS